MSRDNSPSEPTALTATIIDSGSIRLTFEGNNPAGSVYYLIWRMDGEDGRWLPRDTTEEQAYVDASLTPSETYIYRIQAQSTKSVSNFSSTLVVQIPEGLKSFGAG